RELRASVAGGREPGDAVHAGSPCRRLHLQARPPNHGAGAEHLVPLDRPESSEVRAEHLSGQGRRFHPRDPPDPSVGAIPQSPRSLGGHAMKRLVLVGGLLSLLLAPASARAQRPADYDHSTAMVPMRDGIKLNTVIWRPKDQSGPLPILL